MYRKKGASVDGRTTRATARSCARTRAPRELRHACSRRGARVRHSATRLAAKARLAVDEGGEEGRAAQEVDLDLEVAAWRSCKGDQRTRGRRRFLLNFLIQTLNRHARRLAGPAQARAAGAARAAARPGSPLPACRKSRGRRMCRERTVNTVKGLRLRCLQVAHERQRRGGAGSGRGGLSRAQPKSLGG